MDRRDNRRLLGFGLLGIGAIMLLARIGGGTGWLWIALVAIAFLVGYARERRYGFLVIGGVLSGIAVGQLLEGNWGWDNAFLISLGIGIAAIDRIEPRPNRWPIGVGGVLIALGALGGVLASGLLTSPLFALLLVAGGVAILWRGRSSGRWVDAPRPAATTPPARAETPAPERAPEPVPETGDATTPAEPVAPTVADAGAGSNAETAADAADERVARRRAALERWREARAEADGRAPGSLVPDTTLDNIARAGPENLEALSEVAGVGRVTLDRYGSELLDAVAETDR